MEEVFESIVQNPSPAVVTSLVNYMCPKLAAVISTPKSDETAHMPYEAISLCNSLIKSRSGPIEVGIVATVTKAILGLLQRTDDVEEIQVSAPSGK